MALTTGGAPHSPLVDPNRFIAREWLQWLTTFFSSVAGGAVTGPASSDVGAIATWADTTGTTLAELTGTGIVKVTANVAGVITTTGTPTDYLGGDAAFHSLAEGGILKGTTTVLTDAQIKALPTTAVSLTGAPGTNNRIVPVFADCVTNFTAGAYTNINADGQIFAALENQETGYLSFIPNDSRIPITYLDTLLSASARHFVLGQFFYAEPAFGWGNLPSLDAVTAASYNVPFQLFADNNGSGNFTGGNAANTWTITPYYSVVGY